MILNIIFGLFFSALVLYLIVVFACCTIVGTAYVRFKVSEFLEGFNNWINRINNISNKG